MMEADINIYNETPAQIFSINEAEGDLAYLKEFGKLPDFIQDNNPTNTENVEPNLSGGTLAERGSHPWSAFISTPEGTSMGTLINNKWILTCGHCVGDAPAGSITISLGGIDKKFIEKDELVTTGLRVIIHPDYEPITGTYDIALIEISPVEETEFIKSTSLYTGTALPDSSLVLTSTIQGWGATPEDRGQYLLEADVRYICYDPATSRIRCRSPYTPEIGICAGESGSDLEVIDIDNKKKVFGVGVGGNDCSEDDRIADFIATKYINDWVEKVINTPRPKMFLPQIETGGYTTDMPLIKN